MPRPISSTAKRRFEIGDLVTLKVTYGAGFIVGRVIGINYIPKDQQAEYGLYQYTIFWYDGSDAQNSGWSMSDIKVGRLKYLKDLTTLKVLYGRKEV